LEQLVLDWQQVKNLVAASTLRDLWHRHIEDSAQLHAFAPQAREWLDLGSGSGFPGLVMAILGEGRRVVHLVESDRRKCAFLHFAGTQLKLPIRLHCGRIEDVLRGFAAPDVVSARAVADLNQLLVWSESIIRGGALGIFPKGQDVEVELAQAAIYRDLDIQLVPSVTDIRARILLVRARSDAETLRSPS
jgi:16S rRNA (guanine527-N7)-methyltransferase